MPLNDGDEGNEFSSSLEDEDVFDAHPPPGVEIGGIAVQPDRGSGSYAEDGPLEVAEDMVMMDGETQLGSAAMYGPSEIGAGLAAEDGASEIGVDGYIAHDGPSEIGGPASEDGQSEIGRAADVMAPFESFMLGPTRMGSAAMYGQTEIGDANTLEGQYEIGAVARVIEKARDNRQPPPPMHAVDADAPEREETDWGLGDVVIGAAAASGGADQFPLTSQLLLRAGAATEPRYVRVDTEDSYRKFRVENSPELEELQRRLEQHMADGHGGGGLSSDADLSEDVAELVHIGAEAEAAKRVSLWMPRRFEGKVEAWREGDFVCASMVVPGLDGEVRICTSLEPIRKCVAEMARHAAESGVQASTVVGVLPEMGCVLGAGTALKEMAAAAPSILKRPEAQGQAPFVVRIEPKLNPALCALAMLAAACRDGNQQACAEWRKLASLGPGPIQQAMSEALQAVKAAA